MPQMKLANWEWFSADIYASIQCECDKMNQPSSAPQHRQVRNFLSAHMSSRIHPRRGILQELLQIDLLEQSIAVS